MGIIPACAGNTLWRRTRTSSSGDHPRVCGEHKNAVPEMTDPRGSSPRVRGTHGRCRWCCEHSGIIPACAGNTDLADFAECSAEDHPRVCGEHSVSATYWWVSPGSSPRVRGTHHTTNFRCTTQGIIPACAGNTTIQQTSAVRHRGSSPRVRGTRGFVLRDACRVGIIPACAGNTAEFATWVQANRDHPRVCGEHTSVTYPSKRQ